MIFLWIRSSHSVLVLVREDSPSCLDVFFSAAGRSGEGCNYHFILLPHHLFNITLLGKMFSFSQQIFSCFSYDLSHHTPHPFMLNLQLVCSIGYMLVSLLFFFLFLTHYQQSFCKSLTRCSAWLQYILLCGLCQYMPVILLISVHILPCDKMSWC